MSTTALQLSEAALVALLKQKDQTGFSLLYDNYSHALFGVLKRMITDESQAEDTLQDVFVKIWKGIESYDSGKGSLFTWMVNVTRNTAIDRLRSSAYKEGLKAKDIDDKVRSIDRKNNTSTPIEHIGIAQLVTTLKPEQQTIIDLIYFKGYTQVETAEELGIPLGTVKTRVKSAIDTLRKKI